MSMVQLLLRLVSLDAHALRVARLRVKDTGSMQKQSALQRLQALDGVLLRNIEVQRKYLRKLEGQKGSDTSAETSTRKIMSYAKQMELLSRVGGPGCATCAAVTGSSRCPGSLYAEAFDAALVTVDPAHETTVLFAAVLMLLPWGSVFICSTCHAKLALWVSWEVVSEVLRMQVVERVSHVGTANGVEVPSMEIPAWVNTEDNTVPAGAEVMR